MDDLEHYNLYHFDHVYNGMFKCFKVNDYISYSWKEKVLQTLTDQFYLSSTVTKLLYI